MGGETPRIRSLLRETGNKRLVGGLGEGLEKTRAENNVFAGKMPDNKTTWLSEAAWLPYGIDFSVTIFSICRHSLCCHSGKLCCPSDVKNPIWSKDKQYSVMFKQMNFEAQLSAFHSGLCHFTDFGKLFSLFCLRFFIWKID